MDGKTPYQVLHGSRLSIKHCRIFGCTCYVNITLDDRTKEDPSSRKGVFVGYSEVSKAYKVYIPSTRKVLISRDVIFDEGNVTKDVELGQTNNLDVSDGSNEQVLDGSMDEDGGDASLSQVPRRSSRKKEKPTRLTYDEKGKQVVDGTNLALLTCFGTSSCVEDGMQIGGCLHEMDFIYGFGK